PELIRLGKMLFEDKHLSADGTISCATCHVSTRAFADGRPQAIGLHGKRGSRNTPSLLNVALEKELFWDGRVSGLADQVRAPLFNPFEQGLSNDAEVERILRSLPEYTQPFRDAFGAGTPILTDQAAAAIVAYEQTLVTKPSPFDRYWREHLQDAM